MEQKITLELSFSDLRALINNIRHMDEAAANGLLAALTLSGGSAVQSAAPAQTAAAASQPKPTIRQSSVYYPLFKYLRDSNKEEIEMTFAEIAKIIGQKKLTQSAYNHKSWWGNNLKKRTGQSKAWLDAGYQAAQADLDKKTVKFRKY